MVSRSLAVFDVSQSLSSDIRSSSWFVLPHHFVTSFFYRSKLGSTISASLISKLFAVQAIPDSLPLENAPPPLYNIFKSYRERFTDSASA